MAEDETQPKSEIFRENTRAIVSAIDQIGRDGEETPDLVRGLGNVDHTYFVKSGYRETLAPLAETLKAHPDSQFVLSVGLTRSGKTMSAIQIVNTMNESTEGSASWTTMEGSDETKLEDPTYIADKITGQLTKMNPDKLSFVTIDEFGIAFRIGEDEKIQQVFSLLSERFPRTTFMTIDVFGRNRGVQIAAEVEEDPFSKYENLMSRLRSQGRENTFHHHRDAWTHRSFEEAFFALYHDREAIDQNPELARLAAFELEAMALGNPYILVRILNLFKNPGHFTDDELYEKLLGPDALQTMNEILIETNKHVYATGGRDIFFAYEESKIPHLSGYMKTAFGGYRALDLLTKHARGGLHGTQAVPRENIDWSLFGKRI